MHEIFYLYLQQHRLASWADGESSICSAVVIVKCCKQWRMFDVIHIVVSKR